MAIHGKNNQTHNTNSENGSAKWDSNEDEVGFTKPGNLLQ